MSVTKPRHGIERDADPLLGRLERDGLMIKIRWKQHKPAFLGTQGLDLGFQRTRQLAQRPAEFDPAAPIRCRRVHDLRELHIVNAADPAVGVHVRQLMALGVHHH